MRNKPIRLHSFMNTQAELDDIMSSIRNSVEAESSKAPEGSADLIEQAAAEAAGAEQAEAGADDEILELTTADMTAAPTVATASAVADVLGVPSTDDAADEFDKLLAEISAEKQTRAAEVAAVKEALLADIEPLGETPQPAAAPVEEMGEAATPDLAPPTAAAPSHLPAAAEPMALNSTIHEMGMVEGADGSMQLTLPPEVLAMALRPMVQSWLNANLAGVVERLVREEIAKLNG
jgi:uncharacterized protein